MSEHNHTGGWIGASLLRKEDARHLYGRGMFIADINMPGIQEVAFVRSQMAHGNVRHVIKPLDAVARVFTLADIGPINILEAGPELAAHRHSPYPPLADGRVRYVGQTVAACMMPTRAQAEDLVDKIKVELEELPAVVDAVAAMRANSPRVFDEWPNNAYISTSVVEGNPDSLSAAPISLRRKLRLNRQATVSLEGRGVLAYWDYRLDELVVYLSTQGGQVKRLALSRMLGMPEQKVRVIAPDVGGGFGGKNRIMPEDVAVAAIALKVKHPVRWIEDRREHLLASVHARDHTYDLVISADRDGTLLGIEGDIHIDAGAYALWPTGAFQEASMASRNLTGPYRMRHLRLNTYTVATNKAPMGPYRGVARPGATFALERLVDEVARELEREPFDLRRQNIVTASELPYRTAAGMKLDTGDYVASLDIAREKIDLPGIRKRQTAGEGDGRRIGVGFAFYTEQSGHGTAEFMKRKFRVIPGYEFGERPHAAGRRRSDLRWRTQPWPRTRDLARANRRAGAWNRSQSDLGSLWRHRRGTVWIWHFRFEIDRVCWRCRGQSFARDGGKDSPHRRASLAGRRRRHPDRRRNGPRPVHQRSALRRSLSPPMHARTICRPAWIRCWKRSRPTSRRILAEFLRMARTRWWSPLIPTTE